MKSVLVLFAILGLAPLAVSQTAQAPSPPGTAPVAAASNIVPELDRLQSAASQANLAIAHMRIEKWKTDGGTKQQAQSNADSIQRNLGSALPALVASVRAQPQDLTAGFKLYRNLNVLYDVLVTFAESAGAFGPKDDYQALAQQVGVIDSVRRDFADNLDSLLAAQQAEMSRLRTQVRDMQQAAAAPAPPKKVVVDDTEPVKKKAAHSSHAKKASGASSTPSGSSSGTGTPPPAKSQ